MAEQVPMYVSGNPKQLLPFGAFDTMPNSAMPGSSVIHSGTSIIDFGATGKAFDVATVVTGVTGIPATPYVQVFFMGDSTSDNDAEAHLIASQLVFLAAEKVVAGVGFSIRALCNGLVYGTFKIHWNWR